MAAFPGCKIKTRGVRGVLSHKMAAKPRIFDGQDRPPLMPAKPALDRLEVIHEIAAKLFFSRYPFLPTRRDIQGSSQLGGRMTQDWNQRLKSSYARIAREPSRPVRLPGISSTMTVSGEGDQAIIFLKPEAIVRNMQDNAAAFEGWSLALKYWCGANVILDWIPPSDHSDPKREKKEGKHYQRFLYRVEKFHSLFSDWFKIGNQQALASSKTQTAQRLYLNVAGDQRGDPSSKSEPNPEYELECRLLRDDNFNRHYGFRFGCIKDRQFPVGLFSTEKPSNASAIFPGGKGAIDLICLDETRLWLFELKAKANIPIGTVTEVLFYTSVVRDTFIGRFHFAKSAGSRSAIQPGMLDKVADIIGVMLGHDLHPLLGDAGLVKMLNAAAARYWNGRDGIPDVAFRAGQIESDNPLQIVERG